jgi:hypothetical protein
MPEPDRTWLTVPEVAAVLGIPLAKAKALIRYGELRSIELPVRKNVLGQVYRTFRVSRKAIEEYLNPPPAPPPRPIDSRAIELLKPRQGSAA